MKKRNAWNKAALLLCALAALLLPGCQAPSSPGMLDKLTGEGYPDAEKYQAGAFAYPADEISAVEVYWRSGEVEIIESDGALLNVKESGDALPEDAAMHYLLDGGVLRIRFCASGAKIQVSAKDKRLRIEIPKGIALSVHTTSALTRADSLHQKDILIAALSGGTALGAVTAENVDFSSSSGFIRAASVSAQSLKCSASSGSIELGAASAKAIDCSASSGNISMGGVIAETLAVTASSGSVRLSLADAPSADIHTSSGEVALALAKGGAEVLHSSSSGSLLTDQAYARSGDLYVFGNGESKINVETSSGNLKIQ